MPNTATKNPTTDFEKDTDKEFPIGAIRVIRGQTFQQTSTSTAACSADLTIPSSFRSLVSGSFIYAATPGAESRKPRRNPLFTESIAFSGNTTPTAGVAHAFHLAAATRQISVENVAHIQQNVDIAGQILLAVDNGPETH